MSTSSSGGYIANNLRQGYRAEYLAKYIISEFGPCERINPENDYGLDLMATIMKKSGSGGLVSLMYGIQVKSGDVRFHYSGDGLVDWIRTYNIPILMCRANRATGRIKLYSTWTLNHLILDAGFEKIKEIDFIEDYGEKDSLRMPQIRDKAATVWVGPPIIDISGSELNQTSLVEEIAELLTEWIGFDARNYFRRKSDIPILFGYLNWDTNKFLKSSRRGYYVPHFFSEQHTKNAMTLIQECATLIALNQGKDSKITKDLAQIIQLYGVDVPQFTRDAMGIGT